MADLQPFPITEFKTGLFNYLQPWIRPQDAFEPLQDAYIYRGTVNKRQGYVFFAALRYKNYQTIKTGTGGSSYSGTLSFPHRSRIDGGYCFRHRPERQMKPSQIMRGGFNRFTGRFWHNKLYHRGLDPYIFRRTQCSKWKPNRRKLYFHTNS